MNPEVLEYLRTQRVCVVAVEMPDGSPHAATVHFAHSEGPITFIVQTSPKYRKSEAFLNKQSVRTSLVIGLEEVAGGKEKTFQLDGEARLIASTEDLIQTYMNKFPEKERKFSDDIFFAVVPKWWRFTDWSRPEGKTVFNSDGTILVKGKSA